MTTGAAPHGLTALFRAFRSPHAKSRRNVPVPAGATVATSSTRRRAQLLDRRPDLNIVPIRGNVGTRLRKLAEQPEIDAIVYFDECDPATLVPGTIVSGTISNARGYDVVVVPDAG